MGFLSKIIANKELKARRETLAILSRKSDRQLLDCGISPELLKEGIKAWPWRMASEELEIPYLKLTLTNDMTVLEKKAKSDGQTQTKDTTLDAA